MEDTYVYKCTRNIIKAPNVYRVKQKIDLKDEDFSKAAQEYKKRQEIILERERKKRESKED